MEFKMSVKNASILLGAAVGLTGGTATAFTPSAAAVSGGIQIVATADANPATRRSITLKSRNAALDSKTGKFAGKDKRSAVAVFPEVLSDGVVVYNLARVEIEPHPQSAIPLSTLKSGAINLVADSDFDNFWTFGSVE